MGTTGKLALGALMGFMVHAAAWATPTSASVVLSGFDRSPWFDELTTSYTVQPGIHVHINAPGTVDPDLPTRLVLYALPNGNTTSQTIGRAAGEGVDWHYNIQHVGAQIRRIRELSGSENVIVAYLEAERRSWPTWKQNQPEHPRILRELIDSLQKRLAPLKTTVEFTAHSGGGTLLFGLLDGGTTTTPLPPSIRRVALLDSDYAYDNAKGHGDKLANWLRDPEHVLVVACYDDRHITLDGKPVLKNPNSGTFAKTHQLLERLKETGLVNDDRLTSTTSPDAVTRVTGLDGRLEFLIHANPANEILHTVLVEKNGLVHSLAAGDDKLEKKADPFWGERGYTRWIQEGY